MFWQTKLLVESSVTLSTGLQLIGSLSGSFRGQYGKNVQALQSPFCVENGRGLDASGEPCPPSSTCFPAPLQILGEIPCELHPLPATMRHQGGEAAATCPPFVTLRYCEAEGDLTATRCCGSSGPANWSNSPLPDGRGVRTAHFTEWEFALLSIQSPI